MKNEIKIIIILSVVIAILAGYIIYRELDQRAKDRAYKDNIAKLESEGAEFQRTIDELRTDITGLERDKSELIEIGRKDGEIIRRLEDENNSFGKNIKGFEEDLAELEELLSGFLAD